MHVCGCCARLQPVGVGLSRPGSSSLRAPPSLCSTRHARPSLCLTLRPSLLRHVARPAAALARPLARTHRSWEPGRLADVPPHAQARALPSPARARARQHGKGYGSRVDDVGDDGGGSPDLCRPLGRRASISRTGALPRHQTRSDRATTGKLAHGLTRSCPLAQLPALLADVHYLPVAPADRRPDQQRRRLKHEVGVASFL